ncbi:hypothetical protein GGD83_003918 [Rhodoblastus sphagnicola]|uniref:hypothetical protein n=1 Tax=Rhodoblastus sphagnicola TaxID=333368 RepID=UPI00185B9D14|nr:hypothetical protein [Rhodoblastus sphagnicola]MBB4200091.1 hypothetical protein [Rhodoblastus sphagnicola]
MSRATLYRLIAAYRRTPTVEALGPRQRGRQKGALVLDKARHDLIRNPNLTGDLSVAAESRSLPYSAIGSALRKRLSPVVLHHSRGHDPFAAEDRRRFYPILLAACAAPPERSTVA